MWATEMKKVLGKGFLFGVFSCISFTSAYSAIPGEMTVAVSRFEVTAVDTPSITKGGSGVQTATIKNFGPTAATGTIAEIRGSTTTGVTITGVTWGAANTACPLTGTVYSCSVGSLSVDATFVVKITYAVAQNATTSTSVQQTTLAVKSDQANPGSGVGESIHRVWGQPGETNSANPTAYDAFWPGRDTKKASGCTGVGSGANQCGTESYETSDILVVWPVAQKNPIGQYLSVAGDNGNDDTYFVDQGQQPLPNHVIMIPNMTNSIYRKVQFPTASGKKSNYRAWEFETYVYIPASTTSVSACVGESGAEVDDGAYIGILGPKNTLKVIGTPRDDYQGSVKYTVTETISEGGYYKLLYRMLNQNQADKYPQGWYGPMGMSFTGGTCSNTELQKLLETGFPTTITVLDKADLAITKTVDKATAKVGDLLTYKLKVWNKGLASVTGALVTDNVVTDLASVQVVCKGVGTATCPSILNLGTSNDRSITLGLLPLVGKDTNNNDANYLEFTVTGLLYKEPSGASISNTATVAVPSGLTDIDTTNNTSTVTTTVTKNTPITTGDANNRCTGNQSVNLITDTAFNSYGANNVLTPKTYTLNPAVVPYSVAYGTGTNGALQLQGKINWSYGNPRITGSTVKIYVNGTVYAVLTTPGASTNSVATFTALNGATVTPVSFSLGQYNAEATAVSFTLILPTTLTASLTDLKVDFENISPRNSSSDAGDDIGFSLNSLNACLKPTVELKKVSTGGTGTFEFGSFTNLSVNSAYQIQSGEVVTTVADSAQNVRLKNSSSPVESGVVAPVYANAGQAVLFNEKDNALYTLRSVICVDSNATNSGNTTPFNATLSGNNVTIAQANLKFGAKLVCTVTNEKKAGYVFSGRVFNDNSGLTKDTTKAYNGIVDTGEVGIAGSRIELQNCSSKAVLASTVTNANGDFEIQTLQDVFGTGAQICLVQKNVDGYTSVSSAKSASVTAIADTAYDLFTISKNTNSNIYAGFLFGDAQLQLILTQNGQKNIAAGDVVDYPHEIISKSVHKLGNVSPSNTQQPTTGQAWSSLVYYDANCNGVVDVAEQQYDAALKSAPLSTSILPDQKICLVQRVISPSSAKSGDSLTAQFNIGYRQNYVGNTAKTSNSVQDITAVGSAGLDLVKRVREVKSCPSTGADTTIFAKTNTLTKAQNQKSYLEYQINYTNNSAKNLVGVILKDAVPLGTSIKSMCTENSCNGVSETTPLNWNIAGVLAPRATGTVRFCVEVQ